MIKKKRTIFQSIRKDIFKGLKRLYFYLFIKIRYNYITIKAYFLKKKKQKYKISLLLPTRERSKKFQRLLISLIDTCEDKNRIEILLLLDEDDKEISEYRKIINKDIFKSLKFSLNIKNLKSHAIRNNYLAKISNGDIFFPINDDMIFLSKKWDKIIDYEFSKLNNDKPNCLWISSKNIKYNYLHCDYPIINRAWYDRLGYIGSEYFNFWYLDSWICDLSLRSGKYLVTTKIKVDQLSANTIVEEIDATHLRNINSDKQHKDLIIWNDTIDIRKKESKKLL